MSICDIVLFIGNQNVVSIALISGDTLACPPFTAHPVPQSPFDKTIAIKRAIKLINCHTGAAGPSKYKKKLLLFSKTRKGLFINVQ